ncbi:ATP-binding protein [Teredinibacter sp. KSP-S5-2]|uniref:ATP-binding protein n=1 Tax=Teredinibacter sp. KSP-S5-2 TaxID=3034506 RepID=UPI0029341977|nr:ATP-binding protein [Teredinibacter sp. KSP-S5-2]WNO08939.1 ATP-binding protein [Teredinibacter sp. KSP-S5-2]
MIASFLQTLFGRILLILVGVFTIFGVFSTLLVVNSSKNYEQEVTQRIHRELAQHVVNSYLLYENGKPNFAAAKATFENLMILGPNFEFYLVDKDGNIVAHSEKTNHVVRKTVDLKPIKEFITTKGNQGLIFGEDPKYQNVKKIFSVAPIIQMGQTYGYLYVVIGSEIRAELEEQLWGSQILQSGMWLSIGGGALAILVLIVVIRLVTRPLSRLMGQIQEIRELGFETSDEVREKIEQNLDCWDGNSSNDIQLLGFTLMKALEKLQLQYQNIVTIDDLRKELLSHVSHDLRTPLAALLGYLETWEIQQESLTKEKSEQYISTARKSAQKIAVLIEQLFELAHLDGANVSVNKESFPIAELIQDVLQKFTIVAEKKNIELAVEPKDSSILVSADIEKLERVFTNLIENALRHTPEGGKITVEVHQSQSKVVIRVCDTGIGIPEEDLPHVFDPHFKAGNSVRENTSHGGLGLAITKKILELHESVISVQSKIEQGTTFEFALNSVRA